MDSYLGGWMRDSRVQMSIDEGRGGKEYTWLRARARNHLCLSSE